MLIFLCIDWNVILFILESKTIYEEAYILTSEAYNPTHPLVLHAAHLLITALIDLEEYYDFERYARICYECLTRPIDTDSLSVAEAADSLSCVLCRLVELNGPEGGYIVEAEMMVRKAIRIHMRKLVPQHVNVASVLVTLSDILQLIEGNHYNKMKDLLERALNMHIALHGKNYLDVGSINHKLALLHRNMANRLPASTAKTDQLNLATTAQVQTLEFQELYWN